MMAQPLRDDLMVQEQINMDPWSHMVGVMMLNQTGRKPVKTVLPEFLERWPTPEALLRSRIVDIEELIKPLGMYRVRAKRIYKMSIDFLTWDRNDARELHGIGKYGSDSYEIFFKRNYSVQPTDKELLRYLREISQENVSAGLPIPSDGISRYLAPIADQRFADCTT